MPYVAKRPNQKGVVYTDTFDYPNSASAYSEVTHEDPERSTTTKLVSKRVFRLENDGLDYASTLTTGEVTI